MMDLIWTKAAEEKLLEYSFIMPVGTSAVIRSLAEQTARNRQRATVSPRVVQAAYHHWFTFMRDKAVQS